MQKGVVVVGRLVPTDQNAPESVQPTVGAFHHPTPGFETGLPFDGSDFFASTANMSGEAELVHGAAHLGEVVTFVQAQPLGMLWAGCRFSPRLGEIWSWPRPYSTNSSQSLSVRHSVPVPPATVPGIPSGNPFLKAQMRRGPGADARGVQHLPLATGAQHVEDAVGAGAVGNSRPAAAEPMGVHVLGDQGFQHFPEFVGDLETAGGGIGLGGRASPPGQSASDMGAWGLSLWSLPQSSRNPGLASRNGTASFHQSLG